MKNCTALVLSSFLPYVSFFWCLGKTVLRDCGIFWVSSLKQIGVYDQLINRHSFIGVSMFAKRDYISIHKSEREQRLT